MKKVFISQPMNGKTEEEIKAVRKAATIAAKKALGKDVEIIDSYFEEYPTAEVPDDNKGVWYLGKSLQKLAEADIAYFAPGWDQMRGCMIENIVAKQYGIRCIEK